MTTTDAATPPVPPRAREVLSRVQASARGPWYLVGGFLRDRLLGRAPRELNIDLAVPRDALGVSRRLAAELGGAFVPLDEAAGTARIIVAGDGGRLELDVSDFRAPTIEEDLRRRDFTVNAIAAPLGAWLREPDARGILIDPLQGLAALAERRLTACFPGTFNDDPVRILRAFRFVTQLGFTLDPAAEPLMAQAVPKLSGVSGERVRDELIAIFNTDQSHRAIASLNALGALDQLVPELALGRAMPQGGYHHLDVLGHQLETVAQADRFLAEFAEFSGRLRPCLAAYCAEELVEGRSRKSLIKLAGLLHDVGKPVSRQIHPDGEIWFIGHEETGYAFAVEIVKRLRLANREADMVCQLVRHHLRPGFLSREPQVTRRAVYRFYKDLGDHGPACLLTWWADRMATRGPQSRLDQVDEQRAFLEELFNAYFFKAEEAVRPLRLIDGRQLMAALKLAPGPVVGELLAVIEEAQAEGLVHSAEEALALAKQRLAQHPEAP